ncbi:serine hydrolase domain-containing protein [Caballeronia grimmiae]|uniref:serine hydrolase domain-containing protein n=1 Tax=Caballeronia grimmiae TaxID=1071679 RepID=UPI0038B7C436
MDAMTSPPRSTFGRVSTCRRARMLCMAVCVLIASAPGRSDAKDAASTAGSAELSHSELREIARTQIAKHRVPGVVIAIGDATHVQVLLAMGQRAQIPRAESMTVDTLFDVASLTKVVATTTAVLQLVELGLLDLDMPVAHYWPAFAVNCKTRPSPVPPPSMTTVLKTRHSVSKTTRRFLCAR